MVGDIETGNNVTDGGSVKGKKEGTQDRTLGYTMWSKSSIFKGLFESINGAHGGTVVTYLPPTSEVCGSNPGPYAGKVVVPY